MPHHSNHESLRPNVSAVKKRVSILTQVLRKAAATPPPEMLMQWMEKWSEEDREHFVRESNARRAACLSRMKEVGLWDEMDEQERLFMETGDLETTQRQMIDASWLAESIACLLWALGQLEEMPGYDEEASFEWIKSHLVNRVQEDTKSACLRSAEEIDRKRDLAELWNWRCRTRRLLESKEVSVVLQNGMTMDEIVRLCAIKATEEYAFNSPIGNDFPAFGKPFREISVDEFAMATSIAQERHRAFNWLCGYAPGNRWNETPTDT
jgi:hypothetical protein